MTLLDSSPLPPDTTRQRDRTVCSLLREICLPEARVWYLLHVVVLLIGLHYWLGCARYEPGLPWEVRALYRAEGDDQYVGIVCNLARGVFGEASLKESFRSGALSFPLGSMALHALCVACFGVRGFAVADALALFAAFLGLTLFLRVVGVSGWLSRTAAALTLVGVIGEKWNELIQASLLPAFSPWVGGMRFPRPLVTETLVLLTCALALTFLQPRRFVRSNRRAVGLGLTVALLIQGDIHSATGVGLLLVVVFGFDLVKHRFDPSSRRTLQCLVGAILVGLVPFAWQQLSSDPDIARRMGLFRVPRLSPPHQLSAWWSRSLQVLVALGLLGLLQFGLARGKAARRALLPLVGLSCIALGFYLAMPAFGFLTGRNIQVYHFEDRFLRATWWVVLAAAALATTALLRRPTLALLRRSRRPAAVASLAEAILAVSVFGYGLDRLVKRNHTVLEAPPRSENALGAAYKNDFVALTRELSRPSYAASQVLGTLDHATALWWTSFHHRFLLASDPFPSTRPDREHELRLMHLLHLVGVSKQKFETMIQDTNLQVYWLSSAKYAISPLRSFAPRSDYTASQAEIIRHGSPLSGWQIAVPRSEVKRLVALYESQRASAPRFASADLIVLTRLETEQGMAPSSADFRRTFENHTFRVWARQARRRS